MRILAHILISAVAVFAAARLLPGVSVDGFGTAVVVAVVLGLFTFAIIGGLVELTAALVPGFRVANFWWALAFALTLSVINAVLQGLEGRPS